MERVLSREANTDDVAESEGVETKWVYNQTLRTEADTESVGAGTKSVEADAKGTEAGTTDRFRQRK